MPDREEGGGECVPGPGLAVNEGSGTEIIVTRVECGVGGEGGRGWRTQGGQATGRVATSETVLRALASSKIW